MLEMMLQYIGYLMKKKKNDPLEKTLMLEKMEGKREGDGRE